MGLFDDMIVNAEGQGEPVTIKALEEAFEKAEAVRVEADRAFHDALDDLGGKGAHMVPVTLEMLERCGPVPEATATECCLQFYGLPVVFVPDPVTGEKCMYLVNEAAWRRLVGGR